VTRWRIGLTGGIGSGKSTLARLLQDAGADVIDADALARDCTAPGGAAMPAIEARFGAAVLTPEGALDRDRMRALAFAQPDARRALEMIVHPLVGRAIEEAVGAAASRCVVLDIPLLAESAGRWPARLDRVIVVDCDEATQRQRVMARSGWSEAAVQAVIEQQANRAQRRAIADIVVVNEGDSLDALRAQAQRLAQRFGL